MPWARTSMVPGSTGPLQGFAIKCVVRAAFTLHRPRQGIYIKRIENHPLSSLSPRHQMYRLRPCYRAVSHSPTLSFDRRVSVSFAAADRCALSPFPHARPRPPTADRSLSIAAVAAGRTPSAKGAWRSFAAYRSDKLADSPPAGRNPIKYARRDVKNMVTRRTTRSHPETTYAI